MDLARQAEYVVFKVLRERLVDVDHGIRDKQHEIVRTALLGMEVELVKE